MPDLLVVLVVVAVVLLLADLLLIVGAMTMAGMSAMGTLIVHAAGRRRPDRGHAWARTPHLGTHLNHE